MPPQFRSYWRKYALEAGTAEATNEPIIFIFQDMRLRQIRPLFDGAGIELKIAGSLPQSDLDIITRTLQSARKEELTFQIRDPGVKIVGNGRIDQ